MECRRPYSRTHTSYRQGGLLNGQDYGSMETEDTYVVALLDTDSRHKVGDQADPVAFESVNIKYCVRHQFLCGMKWSGSLNQSTTTSTSVQATQEPMANHTCRHDS